LFLPENPFPGFSAGLWLFFLPFFSPSFLLAIFFFEFSFFLIFNFRDLSLIFSFNLSFSFDLSCLLNLF